jgi:hypothetical protein
MIVRFDSAGDGVVIKRRMKWLGIFDWKELRARGQKTRQQIVVVSGVSEKTSVLIKNKAS